MRIRELSISNLRSIIQIGPIPIANLFAFVGENNAGKSTILLAVGSFLSAGSGGLSEDDFNDPLSEIVVKITFEDLSDFESKRWKKYLVDGRLTLEKRTRVETDPDTGSKRIKSEHHGYEAVPVDWYLSTEKISEQFGGKKVDWTELVTSNGLPDYFLKDGKSSSVIYNKALIRFLDENDVEYSEPDVSGTHALGLQSKAVASLPAYYLLPAITSYSSEIDKRQKSSTFRRLMGELSERILKNDPRFIELEQAVAQIHNLLNSITGGAQQTRLEILGSIEEKIGSALKELMPSVSAVNMAVQIDEIKEIFSGGVELTVDDGVNTDVLAKGHGLQRCIIFSLLRTLISTERVIEDAGQTVSRSIILGIEEPELYIHPQLSRLFYDVMRAFGGTDQVLYTTHSPIFVDAYQYHEVAIVSKPSADVGTCIQTAPPGAFDDLSDAGVFKGLARFNAAVSELFFAKKILIVEGPEDLIALTATLIKLEKIKNRAEEIEWSILVAGGKDGIPFLQTVMNAFSIPYSVLHDIDIDENTSEKSTNDHRKKNERIASLMNGQPLHHFPHSLEKTLGLTAHFQDQYAASLFFASPENINDEFCTVVDGIFS